MRASRLPFRRGFASALLGATAMLVAASWMQTPALAAGGSTGSTGHARHTGHPGLRPAASGRTGRHARPPTARRSTNGAAPRAATPRGGTAAIQVGRLPDAIAVDQRNGTVWIANSLDGTVSEISEARQAVIGTIKVPASPVGVAADPKTGTVWVTSLGPFGNPAADNRVTEISDSTGKVLAGFTVGRAPFGIAADSRTGTVWVANTNSYTVSEISETRQNIVATIRVPKDAAPDGVAVDQKTGVVWVSSLRGRVEEISEATRHVSVPIEVRHRTSRIAPAALAVDQVAGSVWVASDVYDGGSIYSSFATEVSSAEQAAIATVRVPDRVTSAGVADAIAADSATGTVWITEDGTDTVTLISESGRSVARNLPVGEDPVAVAVDPGSSTAWVVSNLDDSVREFAYSPARFSTRSLITMSAGSKTRFVARAKGFPVCVMTVHGALPPGVHARLGRGTAVFHGRPLPAARGHQYRVLVTADNGIGAPGRGSATSQQLVIRVR